MCKRLLVIEAHSDDSAIGAYGLIQKLIGEGYEAHFMAVAMSDLDMMHCGHVSAKQRMSEYETYVERMGGQIVEGFTPFDAESRMDTVPRRDVVSALERSIYSVRPDLLICQAPSFHHDHSIVYEATIAALRPTVRFHPDEVLLMENPTYVHSVGPSTDFKPTTYCVLSEQAMTEKIDCFLSCFPSQLRSRENCLSPAGIRSWAKYRALECYAGEYAEAFVSYLRRV